MNNSIEYYCTSLSVFTYLGHNRLLALSAQFNTGILYKPVILPQVFANSGALPLKERPIARQEYRLLEIERWARKRQLPINLHPTYFPTDPSLADRCVIALQHTEENAGQFLGQALTACWAEQRDISDRQTLETLLTEAGLNAQTILHQANTPEVQAIYEANTQEAIDKGVLGVPSYFLNGEQFWGQDRLELLEETIRRSS